MKKDVARYYKLSACILVDSSESEEQRATPPIPLVPVTGTLKLIFLVLRTTYF
jgi:hypothetical protein